MAMATVHRARCKCGAFIKPRAEVGDWEAEEVAYRSDSDALDSHDCPLAERTGDTAPPPEQRTRGGRRASGKAKRPVRNYRYRCACEDGPPIRCGRRDLAVTCNRCGCGFTWDPSGSEQLAPIRQPA